MPSNHLPHRGAHSPPWLLRLRQYGAGLIRWPPFRGLGLRQWLNLLWTALFAFYITFAVMYVRTGGICDYMGADYRAFYASAEIAREKGFAEVYNLDVQGAHQLPIYEQCSSSVARVPYFTVPMPYIPAFVTLFLPLSFFPYTTSYYLWIFLNLAILVFTMIRFSRAIGGRGGRDILLQLIVCLPVFSNMFLGQVNIWLLIGLAEFFLATRRGKDLQGGLWLGWLLLKPQTLILLIPGLLIRRRFKALLGFAVACLAILLVSVLLVGIPGLGRLANLLLESSAGVATSNSHFEIMMNWRALAYNLGRIMPGPLSWGLAMAGAAVTVLVALALWLRPVDLTSPRFGLLLFCTFAATFAATWHAHVHMVLPLIPLILFLYDRRIMPWWVVYVWLLGPPAVFPLAVLVMPGIAYSLFGLLTLALNIFLLAWSAWTLWRNPSAGEAIP